MISGIGIDIVNITRIERVIRKWEDRFKKRVFSQNEIEYSEGRKRSGQHFAASFAVKEAFIKALGKGFRGNIQMFDIEILRDSYGKPYANLYRKAKQIVEIMAINSIHVSISHDGEYSIAVVILEK
jgi:holo-[acyl-carrier protein] synthase